MKNKVWEMLEYAGPQLEEFPRAKRGLAQKIDGTMLDILELVIMLENKHYKKTTLGELDTKVDVLRHLIRYMDDIIILHPDKKVSGKDKEQNCGLSWKQAAFAA